MICIVAGCPKSAAAQQVVILDETYEATSANTEDSHYRVDPGAGAPDNWASPVDYASGRVHARLEVLSKPSTAGTLYNICFEATPSYACMPYSPEYTEPGVYDFEYDIEGFYQYDMVDWSQGTERIALILKDHDEVKRQGDPDFYPTQIHITITLVAPGATYQEPVVDPDPPEDAGEPDPEMDAALPQAGSGAAGTNSPPQAGSAAEPPAITPVAGSGARPAVGGTGGSGQGPTMMNAGAGGATSGAGGSTAGTGALGLPTAGNSSTGRQPSDEQTKDDTASLCSVSDLSRTHARVGWWVLALASVLSRRKRRRSC